MIDALNGITSTAVSAALDGLALRQQLIAANLAQAGGGDTSVRGLRFEDALSRALADREGNPAQTLQGLLRLRDDLREGKLIQHSALRPVDLDIEMLRLNETVIRYQALIEGLGKYGSLMHMAISGEARR